MELDKQFSKKIEEFGTKPGLLKTDNNIQGVIIKGLGKDFNWDYLDQIIVSGTNKCIF